MKLFTTLIEQAALTAHTTPTNSGTSPSLFYIQLPISTANVMHPLSGVKIAQRNSEFQFASSSTRISWISFIHNFDRREWREDGRVDEIPDRAETEYSYCLLSIGNFRQVPKIKNILDDLSTLRNTRIGLDSSGDQQTRKVQKFIGLQSSRLYEIAQS